MTRNPHSQFLLSSTGPKISCFSNGPIPALIGFGSVGNHPQSTEPGDLIAPHRARAEVSLQRPPLRASFFPPLRPTFFLCFPPSALGCLSCLPLSSTCLRTLKMKEANHELEQLRQKLFFKMVHFMFCEFYLIKKKRLTLKSLITSVINPTYTFMPGLF